MQIRSEETRTRILEAASRLFSNNGYDATGVADICVLAGISKGAFYYHFSSKQALFLALLEAWLKSLDAAFQQIQKEATTVPEAIQSMAHMAGEVLKSSESNLPIIIEFWIQAYRDPTIWQAAIAPYRRYQDFFARLIQNGIQEGTLQQVDPHVAARLTVALGVGLLFQALFDTQSEQWDVELRESVKLLLKGFARRDH
jgi:AcrR family transcriptional regulator